MNQLRLVTHVRQVELVNVADKAATAQQMRVVGSRLVPYGQRDMLLPQLASSGCQLHPLATASSLPFL
eukprot:127629-Amphidinium_carterae.1